MFLYNLGIKLYSLGIRLVSFWNPKAKAREEGQNQSLPPGINPLKKKCIWIHCASLGEFEQARSFIELISERQDAFIALSFFSPSGYEVRKNYEQADMVFYLPLDTIENATTIIDRLDPDLAIFVKYELWFNHLKVLGERKIATYFIAASFRPDQYFFRSPFAPLLEILQHVNHFIVQDESSRYVLSSKGITQVTCLGDPRIDSVSTLVSRSIEIPSLNDTPFTKVIIYGSIYLDDLPILIPYLEKQKDYLHIVVPHDISSRNVKQICKLLPSFETFKEDKSIDSYIQVIDSIGLLTSVYAYADMVYIGGGFGKGIHNILEPAVFGNPVIFGPKYRKFKEAKDLIKKKSAFSISSTHSFEITANEVIEKDKKEFERINNAYFAANQGASLKSYELIFEKGDI